MTGRPRPPHEWKSEMSDKNVQNKHRYSVSGRETTSKFRKRHRSTEEDQERKKGRRQLDLISSSESEESIILTDIEEKLDEITSVTDLRERLDLSDTDKKEDMDEKNFCKYFATALRNDEICSLMAGTFEKTIDAKIKPVQDSIEKVKQENIVRDSRVSILEDKCNILEMQVDEYEQSKRDRNIIISGLEDDKCNQDGALEFLKTIPGINVSVFDIDSALKLRNPPNGKNQVNRLRVVLQEKGKKTEIMKGKKNLSNSVKKWINDDLTALRSRLGYQARMCVKAGKLEQTWAYDSKIFVKRNGESSGRLVRSAKDLPDVQQQ